MKNNSSLRLAQAALACALFGTLFTSCAKEDDILPLSQTAVLTDDLRHERGQSLELDARKVHTQSFNNEQSKIAEATAGEVAGGGKLIGKRPDDRCTSGCPAGASLTGDVRQERGRSFEMDARKDHTQAFNDEESKVAGPTAGEISTGYGKLIDKRPTDRCDIGRAGVKAQTSDISQR